MIRPARPHGAEAIHTLVSAAYGRWVARFGREPSPMQDDYALRIADGQAWVLERAGADEGAILGLILLKNGPQALMIPNIAVTPAAQGKGFGKQLLAFAAEEARRRGYNEIRLYVNALMVENIALYEHLGFREIDRVRGEERDRVYLCMAKPVS